MGAPGERAGSVVDGVGSGSAGEMGSKRGKVCVTQLRVCGGGGVQRVMCDAFVGCVLQWEAREQEKKEWPHF
jgi:hypothetical protein